MSTPLTAPKEGADVRLGREMAEDAGWLLRRIKRVEELIAQPAIMAEADEIARHVERYALEEGVEVKELEPQILPSRSLEYIRIVIAGRPCSTCAGSGYAASGTAYCPACDGAGYR